MTATVTHTVVTAEGARPERAILFLHGILGSGGNWRTFARRFVAARPDWAAVLVDLRNVYPPEEVTRHGFIYEGVGRGRKA